MAEEVELRLLEEALLDPAVRRNPAQLEKLLAEDFREFGSSGRIWTRQAIIDLLATEAYTPMLIEEFNCRLLSGEVALVTYRAVRTTLNAQTSSLRSSLWIRISGEWRLCFHQGTPIP